MNSLSEGRYCRIVIYTATGPTFIDPFRQAASYVDRILRGENPPTFRCRPRPTAPRTNSMIEKSVTSGYGTSVWTGRALQVGYDGLEIVGLAHLYSAL